MLSSVIVVVLPAVGCRCWGTANYSFILMRGRKIGSRSPGIEPGSRTFETESANDFATVSFFFFISVYLFQVIYIFFYIIFFPE